MRTQYAIWLLTAALSFAFLSCEHSTESVETTTAPQLLFSVYGPHIQQGIYASEKGGVAVIRLTPDSMFSPARYSCSPDGEAILFAVYSNGNSDIWKITRRDRTLTRVTSGPAFDEGPQWLYDGSGFVFRSNRSGRYSVWMSDANGGNLRQIAPDTGNTFWPSTSPKYPLIAYSMNGDTPYIYDYDRNILIPLAPDSLKTNASSLAWALSGDKVAFESGHTLYTWSLTGGLQKGWIDEEYIWNPVWSPDGTEIAFNSYDRLEVVNLLSGKSRVVGYGMAYGGRSSWSPDGNRIAFESLNRPCIVMVPPDGRWNLGVPVGENAAVAPQWINAIW